MNKEFVTYEQALALKELGFEDFDFNLLGFFNFKGEFFDAHARGFNRMAYEDDSLLAPLKQQAFRWFREKHGSHSHISKYKDNNFYHYDIFVDFIDEDGDECFETYPCNDLHNTYEEAEQACLDKLIEIVKNK